MNKDHHRLNGLLVGGAIALHLNPSHLLAGIGLGLIGALLPDFDAKQKGFFDELKKRKSLHNLAVCGALLLGGLASPFVLYLAIGVVSHVSLDMFCSRRGVALFYPLSSNEFGTNGGITVNDERAILMTLGMSIFQILFFVSFL